MEVEALGLRVHDAEISATAKNSLPVLNDFGLAVLGSHAVMSKGLGFLHSLINSDNALFATFHKQVRAGARLPEDNVWDRGRTAVESTIHPNYFDEIHYASLSLDGRGLPWFGAYYITLKDRMVAQRTSVFEENPFRFCDRHNVVAGKPAPPGYRATWGDRGSLAMAKLHSQIDARTAKIDYADILMEHGNDSAECDFIEAHIYGPIHRNAIASVTGAVPLQPEDRPLWRQIKRTLATLGATVEEI